jgi:HEPN domain-containing protein
MRSFFKSKLKRHSQRVNPYISTSVKPYRGQSEWAINLHMDSLNIMLKKSIKAKDLKLFASLIKQIKEFKNTHPEKINDINDRNFNSHYYPHLYYAINFALETQNHEDNEMAKKWFNVMQQLISLGANVGYRHLFQPGLLISAINGFDLINDKGGIATDIIKLLVYNGARLKIDDFSKPASIELTMSRIKLLKDFFSEDETILQTFKDMLNELLLKMNRRKVRIYTYGIPRLLNEIDDAIEALKSPDKVAELYAVIDKCYWMA